MLIFSIFLIPSTYALVDCFHGFIGRMQASVEDNYFYLNDTAMCSAMYCIKVVVNSAIDDDGIFQQGVSSRCAYTGGDRQVCTNADGKCQNITFYEGMKGNFSFCCCKDNRCNSPTNDELDNLYTINARQSSRNSSNRYFSNIFFQFIILFIFLR